MTCEETLELISPYLDDELAAETRRRLEKHLLTCQACAWEAQTLRITRDCLRADSGEVIASDAFRARTLSALRADNPHLTPAETNTEEPSQYQLPMALF